MITRMQALFEILTPNDPDWALARAVDPGRLPAHIAVIMDGNGRWAKKRNMPRVAGHRAGVEPVRSCVETCARLGIRALTLYAFSVENWKRPRAEIETLWRLLRYYLKHELPNLMRNNIRFQTIGRIEALPHQIQRELQGTIDATARNTGLRVSLAINYGGRAEIVDAVAAMVEKARRGEAVEVTEESFNAHLYTAGLPEPDLLIRTSGEMRISNFLLWQIAYAELYVTNTLWPDFKRADLLRAVLDYQKRDRRFGGLSQTSDDETVDDAAVMAGVAPLVDADDSVVAAASPV
ncbi:MAG TPA: isoprenyl transferase [Bryobacteraceae bacterium]|jgi:undecaprenyl diphosphate synthase